MNVLLLVFLILEVGELLPEVFLPRLPPYLRILVVFIHLFSSVWFHRFWILEIHSLWWSLSEFIIRHSLVVCNRTSYLRWLSHGCGWVHAFPEFPPTLGILPLTYQIFYELIHLTWTIHVPTPRTPNPHETIIRAIVVNQITLWYVHSSSH